MHPDELCAIAQQWFKAFNNHNLQLLLSLYAEEAVHYSPKLKIREPQTYGLIKGKQSLYDWWNGAFQRYPSLQYESIQLTADRHRVFMEYIRHVADEEDLRVGEVLEVQDRLIIASRVYHG